MTKKELLYATISGITATLLTLTLTLTLLPNLITPPAIATLLDKIERQNIVDDLDLILYPDRPSVHYNEVTCYKLTVLNEHHRGRITLDTNTHGGQVNVCTRNGMPVVKLIASGQSGSIQLWNNDLDGSVLLTAHPQRAYISIWDSYRRGRVTLGSDKDGGYIGVYNNHNGSVRLSTNNNGGQVTTYSKDDMNPDAVRHVDLSDIFPEK